MGEEITRRTALTALALTPLALPALTAPTGLIPAAQASPLRLQPADWLDAVADNADGESAGGYCSTLPTDRAVLREALDQARASEFPAQRYATLARQYWLAVAAEHAGIDLDAWHPAAGLAANLDTVDKIYINYLRLASSREEFYWVGMAGLAGLSFAAGFWDLDMIGSILSLPVLHQLGNGIADSLAGLPWQLVEELPRDVQLLATHAPRLTQADVDWYLQRLLAMQRHIFMDMVTMHEAYAAEGLPAIEELAASGDYDERIVGAWGDVAAGTPESLARAIIAMADREQNQIVADQWDATSGASDAGRTLTYITTIGGSPDVPGSSPLAVFRPLSVTAPVNGRRARLHTALPAFNWADRQPRWEYIAGDMVPAYLSLMQQRPAEARAVLGVDFRARAAQNRIAARLPAFLAQITSGWAVEWL